jgi:putative ABC transport system permease protein
VAIFSHRVWQERFGADREIAGKTVTLNDSGYTIAGVLPADFRFASRAADFEARNQPDIWTPLALDPQKLNRGTHPLRVIARLQDGVDLAQASAELGVTAANLARLYPIDNRDRGIVAIPLTEQLTANVRLALQMLLGAVGMLLLLACANVANLLLGRAAARQREIAVRVALGAGRGRLTQQLLTESLVLAATGGLGGTLLAVAGIRALIPHLPADLSRAAQMGVDARTLAFTAAISAATGILFGLGPLFAAGRSRAGETLKQSNRIAGGVQSGFRNALAVAQIAIAIVLLIGAGLMAKSFLTLTRTAPGFRPESVLTARLSLPRLRYPDNRSIGAFERSLLENLRARPGVQSAGLATYLPLSGSDNGWAFFIEGRPPLPVGVFRFAKYRPVSEGYFETIGIPLVRGRFFHPQDTRESWTVVINDSMARMYWAGEDPIGQRLRFNSAQWRTIVGIAGDVLHEGLDGKSKPEMYVPVTQAPNVESSPTLLVRTGLDTSAVASEVRSAVAALDRGIPVDRLETMEQVVAGSIAQPRFRAVILGVFSILALAMASIGVYGVMNYLVVQRTREFGIRISMGATRSDVLRQVLGTAAVLIAAGTCIGLAGSVWLAKWISTLLFGTAPLDAITFTTAPIFLIAVALAASFVPALRATRVDPIVALRHE